MSGLRSERCPPYRPVKDIGDLDKYKLDGVGSIVLIINKEGKVYAVRELDPEKGNSTDVLTEKRKKGEHIQENVWGALVEEAGVEAEDIGHFWYIPGGGSLVGGAWFPHHDLRVRGDVVLLYYSGDKSVFDSRNEVQGIGFVDIHDLRNNGVRPATIPALDLIIAKGAINNLLAGVSVGNKKPVFPPGFDPVLFMEQRAQKPDLFINRETK